MKHVPNAITLGNLCAGCLGIVALFGHGPLEVTLRQASYWIFLSLLLDFLDGLAARLLQAQSDLGKELDSLADLVSFGVLPGLMWLRILEVGGYDGALPFIALFIPVCGALRLARFNLEAGASGNFRGLPIPANALAVAGLAFSQEEWGFLWKMQPYSFGLIILLLGSLMLSRLPMLSLKFEGATWAKNWARYLLLLGGALGLGFYHLAAIPVIFVFYLGLSFLYFSWLK